MEGLVAVLFLVVIVMIVVNAVRMHKKKAMIKQLISTNSSSEQALCFAKEQLAVLTAFHDKYAPIADADAHLAELNGDISRTMALIDQRHTELQQVGEKLESTQKKLATVENRVLKLRDAYERIKYSVEVYEAEPDLASAQVPGESFADITSIAPVVINALSIKDLRARYRDNEKNIQSLVASYAGRYTTKANEAIYKLMVMGMEAELQNIIYMLKFGKLEDAVDQVKQLTAKYYTVAADGNQTIAATLNKFIAQLEYQYIQAVNIEYEYYIKREAAREQQRALKEQMRQEAEERKRLEEERRKVEAEEQKYLNELQRLNSLIATSTDAAMVEASKAQLTEISAQMASIEDKKADIVKLQNGKAGTVYIISNIGSFGDDVFKIGMTRRLEAQDRVDELGSASVPFPFDVHSFIFSDDAVDLEARLHHELNNRRLNKVNLRKEFFNISISDLQSLVERIDPSAEFNITAAAEQFRQSQSITETPEDVDIVDDESDDIAG